jgi:alkylation response protein AidB-like acyl-CoA dehydrogenase
MTTTESNLLLESVDRFVSEEVAPRAAAIDESDAFPREAFDAGARIGLTALWVPPEYGGLGVDLATILRILERIGRASAAVAAIFATYGDVIQALKSGSEDVQARFLPRIASGELIPCFALSEPEAGSDAGSITSSFRLEGDTYVLNGRKQYASNGSVAGIFALMVVEQGKGPETMSVFAATPEDAGLLIGRDENLSGLRGNPTTELILDDLKLPREMLLGAEGDGFAIAKLSLSEARLTAAAIACGVARAALEMATEYAGQRIQFGVPIIKHQGVGFKLADAATDLAAGWLLIERATELLERDDREAAVFASMAKVFCTDAAMRITTDAVQVFGGAGLSRDLPLDRLMRDAKVWQIVDGTNEIQRLVIARYLERHGLPRSL